MTLSRMSAGEACYQLSSADFFSKTNLPGILTECQTVYIKIRTETFGPDLIPFCLQTLSADKKKLPQARNELIKMYMY